MTVNDTAGASLVNCPLDYVCLIQSLHRTVFLMFVDIPSYVKDMKWNIAEKYALVACGSDNILVSKC